MKRKETAFSNVKIAIIFFVFLAFIIGISLIFKFVALLENGQYDNSRSFSLSITNGKNIELVTLSPSLKNITIFKFTNNVNPIEAGRLLEIPIDGNIFSNSLDLNQRVNPLFIKTILDYTKIKTNLTIVDLLRILLFARAIPEDSIDIIIVRNEDKLVLDENISRLVSDASIENDSQTIQIINATEVTGLGNRLAKLITNMGGNVLIVATENNKKNKSFIRYIDKKTYTIERLQKVLGYEVIKGTGNDVSDITIIIGEDKVNSAPF